ncbi:lysophospholipid acyltransferase family protein [Thiocystis violacea]|uniref:lysophospholipid acyltransferase family protein n=1 Tax=Thiocystis violacea TaxID=13725 RepID=UPI0019088DAB|nr:lysophospholipid acyltransferase family protein [Thiocystis violacea]MBK1725216.1 1-acyl-sn-glycerol-3-phosphate acyltransferase [Thiocystis violacea]
MSKEAIAAGLLAGVTRLITGVRGHWQDPSAGQDGAQRVYFANHSSHLDTLVIWSSLPKALRARTRPVAAADYWDRPGLRRWLALRVLNALPVERAGGCGSRDALHHLIAALDAGDSLILFPEGTRGDGQAIGELRSGLYHVARERPQVELVPVFLENLSRILPKGEVLPVPLIGRAHFGLSIRLAPDEDRKAFLTRARLALTALGDRK